MLLIMVINKIQESCIYLFLINGQLLDIFLPENVIYLITFDSGFSYTEVWFTDQNSFPLEADCKINITLDIKAMDFYLLLEI